MASATICFCYPAANHFANILHEIQDTAVTAHVHNESRSTKLRLGATQGAPLMKLGCLSRPFTLHTSHQLVFF